jgi:HAD superfamily hydrolase (TIGR01484 family)
MKAIEELPAEAAAQIRFVLFDIDGTITTGGKLTPEAYSAIWALHKAGFKVIPLTGRPAGWCNMIARQWPVDGVIGENGALAFWEENGHFQQFFHPAALRNTHPLIESIRKEVFEDIPIVRLAKDQAYRLYDLAIDFAEDGLSLPLSVADQIKQSAEHAGAQAKISSIHVNIWMGHYDKVSMAERFLTKRFNWIESGAEDNEVLFIGDSPNDEPMFRRFPQSCAVANISRYEGRITHWPAYVARAECGAGFAEIVSTLLAKSGHSVIVSV